MDKELKELWYQVRMSIISHKLVHPMYDEELVKAMEDFDQAMQDKGMIE